MKVNTNAPSHPGLNVDKSNATEASRANEAKENKNQVTNTSSGSTVEISDDAKLMKQAKDIVHQTPDVRSDRVEALKQKIRSGTYQVDAGAVAEKLLTEHLENYFGKNNL